MGATGPKDPTRNNQLFGPSLTEKGLSAYSDNNLGQESADKELAFDEKKECRKSCASVTLNK